MLVTAPTSASLPMMRLREAATVVAVVPANEEVSNL